jgi:hypothetical protein
VLLAPAAAGESAGEYAEAFHWEMLVFDLAIVLLLALALPGDARRVGGALAVYTAGVLALSGIVLGDSDIDRGPLALGRFDLIPAFCLLAAVLARDAARSATWGALLAVGAAVKVFPAAVLPALLRGEERPRRVALAAAVPLVASIAIVVGWGDEFGSAVSYHAERELQIESLAATPLEIAGIDDPSVAAEYGSGSFNFVGPGSEVARTLSIAALVFLYGLIAWAGWRSPGVPRLQLATALLAALVILSPVLSPQFLLWLLPLSAAAFGLGLPNLVLVGAMVMTQLMLQQYSRIAVDFDPEFVWRLAARNTLLLAYLALVCVPIVRSALQREPARSLEA